MSNASEKEALLQIEQYGFEELAAVMRLLRAEDGCPWDREQNHHSIRSELIEETYEVVEAIDRDDPVLLREELGDLLFQIFFHAQIETEAGRFGLAEIVDDITKKMIYRHPHVFGTTSVESSADVLRNWEALKTVEKQRNTLADKLRAIPPMMPALMRASKVGKKLGRGANCDRETLLCDLVAELEAMRKSPAEPESEAAYDAIGSLLLRLTDLSRAMGVDAEHALYRVTNREIDEIAEKAQ